MIISVSAYPKKLENLSFVEISEINTTISLLSALYNSPVLILIPISFCSFLYSWWRHILVFGCFIKYLFSCSCNHKLFFAATQFYLRSTCHNVNAMMRKPLFTAKHFLSYPFILLSIFSAGFSYSLRDYNNLCSMAC